MDGARRLGVSGYQTLSSVCFFEAPCLNQGRGGQFAYQTLSSVCFFEAARDSRT